MTLRKCLTLWIMIHYLINFVSMAVSIFPWLSFTLTYPGTLSSAHNVQIGGRYIEQVDHAKLLGVMIDNTMCWEHHINTICCIVSSGLSLLCCIKPYLNFDSAFCFLPEETAPCIFSYDSFVFRGMLVEYSTMPTSVWPLSLYF